MSFVEQRFENHRDISERYSKTIIDFKNRLKKLEDKLFQRETHLSDTSNCQSRIQSLESTVQELSKLVKKQNDYTNHIDKLETIIMNQEKALAELKKEVLQNKIYTDVFPDKHDAIQDTNLYDEDTKGENNNTSGVPYIRSTNAKGYLQESVPNRSKIFFTLIVFTLLT